MTQGGLVFCCLSEQASVMNKTESSFIVDKVEVRLVKPQKEIGESADKKRLSMYLYKIYQMGTRNLSVDKSC